MLYFNPKLKIATKEYLCMTSITQDMKYRLSFIEYTQRYGISKATRKTKWSIHLSLNSSWESLHDRSRRPHSTMD